MSKLSATEEKFLKVWNNPYLFTKNLMKINDKTGKKVPFIWNKMQKSFVENMDNYNIILKARQGGMSVCICSLAIYYAITEPECVCMLLSHNDESTRAIFNKLKAIYNSIPEPIRLPLIRNNRAELQLANGSIISCSTLGRTDKGRGNTAKLIHLSEFAFVDSEIATKQLLSLEQTLRSDGQLIIETTANGLNFFHNHYQKSKKGENAYKSFFYNYLDTSCMFQEQYKQYKKIFKNRNGYNFEMSDLTEEELQLLNDYKDKGMNLDILCWRRLKIANSSEDKFNQEFPLTDEMAFITSGASIFDNKRITDVLRALQLKKNKYINKKDIDDLPMELNKFYGKSFFMYQKPQAGKKYYIGVDTSEGVNKDSSTVVVLNKDGEEIAMFKNNKIKPYQFAEFVNALGRYYNKAYLVVEKASGGHSVIERLRYEYKYMNMCKYKSYDQFNRTITQIGFDTNAKTKGIIINDLREMFDKGALLINSEEILEEMKVFEIKDNGSMGAMSGYHDDLVMAIALALNGVKEGKWYKW
ncbi:hypothetical protein P5F24_04210 [Clostridium perfringens]|nr:hypothetical protein [Clostridium perfringens]